MNLEAVRASAETRSEWIRASLRDLVRQESPSEDRAAVNAAAAMVEAHARALGGRIRHHRQKSFGDILELRFGPARSPRKPILLLGHLDTVWPMGTLKTMPWREENKEDGRFYGPGVLDMKAGVAMALTAVEILKTESLPHRPVILLLTGDEETGSHASRDLLEKTAARCEAVYVLEPAQGLDGAYKTARKGIANYRVHVTGVAAHSGVNFEQGHSAIAELARQVAAIESLTDLKRGVTVNVGTIHGGTHSNVIPAEAWAEVDVRVPRASDFARIDHKLKRLRPHDKSCVLKIEGGMNRPPMERTGATVALYRKAAALAAKLGFELEEAATGGGSDGNFTSALGIPTLDGMGAVGEGAHARNESILLKHLAPRTALLAAMLLRP